MMTLIQRLDYRFQTTQRAIDSIMIEITLGDTIQNGNFLRRTETKDILTRAQQK